LWIKNRHRILKAKNKKSPFLFVYCFSLNLLKQFACARCSKYKSFQNYKTTGINKEPDFIRGRRTKS